MEELLFDSIRMKIPDAQFRMSTDSMVLADFCRIRPGSRVLDLGCGCGTLGLLLLGADETLRVCGIEIQEAAARQAQENAEENGFSDHLHIVCGDLRQAHAEIAPGSFDCVLSNPPYYPPGSGYLHAQDSLSAAAAQSASNGQQISLLAARLEPKRIRFVRHRAENAVNLVLIEARLGGGPGLQFEPDLVLYTQTGELSAAGRRIYHLQE